MAISIEDKSEGKAKKDGENVLLDVRNLKQYFPVKKGVLQQVVGQVKAVDGVSFRVFPGETLGLVGESGCGKTTTGRSILKLTEPTSGEIIYKGQHLEKLSPRGMRPFRREMQIIFQDPYSSLNPRMLVYDIISEPIKIHHLAEGKGVDKRVYELLDLVGLNRKHAKRYPHEFSGGQRQRIGVARALAVEPELVICDEPVSALDVSIQAQIINLLEDLQNELHLSYIFIAHDLSVVKHISDRVAVMYLGRIVEVAVSSALYAEPKHPYTQALLSAIPEPQVSGMKKQRILLQGDVPSPINPPAGCHFHTRCRFAQEVCSREVPALKDLGNGHLAACHLAK
ncbi:Putative ABC transporter [Acididesulfobacillus acetoxydans]|uniref:ABC transporter n=1 Tax=Acididesulfobacillus acetoxydans TaxID=1561005 RepID=A0A8S0WGT0_9FIRM|nr:dipeptide ABC transporter ATP-binding protein [Acididesulfobacillus acetoxydans]CAA7602162.1 Putative ABC transporter [Acididesulfobacillus acetoxydans]CEJ08718.1 Oligopeptide transport ATP-binding protein AppF [Acididesulfobacillus acetoxydans]